MKKSTPVVAVMAIIAAMLLPTLSVAAVQSTVNLGSTATFAVLAGSAITNTGATGIEGTAGGDVGLFPGTAYTGGETVTLTGGAIHINDAVAQVAKDDLVIAYDDAVGRAPVTRIPTELGGTTLIPGVYDSADGTFQITGTLTLDAQGDPEGVFIFKSASTLITASGSNVLLTNSARYCRVFWPVGSSATLGTNSSFAGHILAMTSITANTGADVQGQLLARNGAVTLNNNYINNGVCLTAPPVAPPVSPPRDDSPTSVTPIETTVAAIVTTPAIITPTAIEEPLETTAPAVVSTIDGGELPKTSSNLYGVLYIGAALILLGGLGLYYKRKQNKEIKTIERSWKRRV